MLIKEVLAADLKPIMMQKLMICDSVEGELTLYAEIEEANEMDSVVCKIESFLDGNNTYLTIDNLEDMDALIKRLEEIRTKMRNQNPTK